MLRQEDPHSTTDPVSAAQTRVTPEELAHAIATLEARKQDAARVQENTIPIGEAVRELNLDATPEEVLAEVRAQRQAQSASPPPKQAAPSAAQTPPIPVPPLAQTVTNALRQAAHAAAPGLKDAARAASPALKQGMDAVSRYAKQPRPQKRTWGKEAGIAFGLFFAFVGIAQVSQSDHHQHVHSDVHSAPVPRMLSTVPDDHEVSADTATVISIARGAPGATASVLDGSASGSRWTLVRHDKHWYVRGYVLESATLGDGPVKVYTDDDAGVLEGKDDVSVTLRLDNSQITDTNAGDDWSEIDMSQPQPDNYTHEHW